MKIRLLWIALVAIIVGLGACGGSKDDPKSNEKDILKFTTGTDIWCEGNCGTTITNMYPKGTTPGTLTPTIIVSAKATYSPQGAQNFFTTAGVIYTVTAEDGTEKTYTVKATVSTTN